MRRQFAEQERSQLPQVAAHATQRRQDGCLFAARRPRRQARLDTATGAVVTESHRNSHTVVAQQS